MIPGLYDGHSRTFFFADYAGIKERRGVTTVNTVPNAATRAGDFSNNYRDRNGNIIPIAGRGILYGPGHVNVDTSLWKRFVVAGRGNAEFRWDVFNVFNHPGFGFPNAATGTRPAGRITTTVVDNRSMQFCAESQFLKRGDP